MNLFEPVLNTFSYFVITITGIFVIVNPLTTAFVFLSLLPDASEEKRKTIAKRSTKVSTAIFIAFAILGSIIFKLFGITLAAFRIAGGIILFSIAMGMLNKKDKMTDEEVKKAESDITDDISVIPLAIPFISGPGSIATVMILTSEAPSIYHTLLVFLAIFVTTISCYYSMVYSEIIVKYLGDTGKEIMTKVFGLILAVVAVQFIINGIIGAMVDHGLYQMIK